jgi:hypothetical protein
LSFWDTHDAGSGGGGYLSPEEKEELVVNETPFDVTAVRYEPENKFGPRFVVTLVLPDPTTGDPETRMVGFHAESGVTSRNDLLQAMIDDHFGPGETAPIPCILTMGGQAFLLKPAPEAAPAKAAAGRAKGK